jgi:Ca2+-binding EF-hand superfamily protein
MDMVRDKVAKDGAAAVMDEVDVNKDGVIDQAENDRFVQNYLEGGRAAGRQSGPPAGDTPPQTSDSSTSDTAAKIFAALDTNKDGTISMDELQALPQQSEESSGIEALMKLMDGNGDKSVSKDEFTTFLQQQQKAIEARQQQADTYREGENQAGGTVDTVA